MAAILVWCWIVFAAILTFGGFLFSQATDVPSIVLALAVSGIGIGPLIVTLYTFATVRTPAGRSATMMTMVGAGIIVGQSIAAAVVGNIGENVGTHAALFGPGIAAALVLLFGVVNWILARRD